LRLVAVTCILFALLVVLTGEQTQGLHDYISSFKVELKEQNNKAKSQRKKTMGLHVVLFWPFGPLFPFILAVWDFISFHFGLLGLHFLSFWPFGLSFPFILAFWAFIPFHFGLLGLPFILAF